MNNSTDNGCALLRDIVAHPLTVPFNVAFLFMSMSVAVSSVDMFSMLLQTVTIPVRGFRNDDQQPQEAVANALQFTVRLLLQMHAISSCAYGGIWIARTLMRLYPYAFVDTSNNCLQVNVFGNGMFATQAHCSRHGSAP